MADKHISNDEIADLLCEIADLLEIKSANPFRIQSYRDAAETVRSLEKPIAETALQEGREALAQLPDIGEGISRLIQGYVRTGRSELLEQLQGEISPGMLFQKVPGIGEELSKRIVEELDIDSLEELEQAAHDGRLAQVAGFGEIKVRNIQVSLAGMLSRSAQRARREAGESAVREKRPDVSVLLDVDREYRRKAEAGQLRKITPKRFNPEGKAWLPILNTRRGAWDFTALFSNTAQAHELNKTHDWVVLYFERDGEENQATVVTETQGPLKGKRVVRGREAETRRYYPSEQ
jgi:hypothetical protein